MSRRDRGNNIWGGGRLGPGDYWFVYLIIFVCTYWPLLHCLFGRDLGNKIFTATPFVVALVIWLVARWLFKEL